MNTINKVTLTGQDLTIEQIKAVARDYVKVEIDKKAFSKSKQGYDILQTKIKQKEKIYGVTTGFGEFSQVFINPDKAAQLQLNLIRSHSTGVGDPAKQNVDLKSTRLN